MLHERIRESGEVADINHTEKPRPVKIGLTDIDGIMRGKYISAEKFESAAKKGLSFCDVVLGWDINDQLYDNSKITGWHTGYPDRPIRILKDTLRTIPFEDDQPFYLCEFTGEAEAICPRGILRSVLERLKNAGFTAKVGFEYEFFLFDETPHSVREKGYTNLKTLSPGFFGYSVLRSSAKAELWRDLLTMCDAMQVPLEGLHTETGAGVLEAAISADEALNAADKAVIFKTFTKAFAQQRDLMACFMAKWSMDWPGQSGHIHISLADASGRPAFYEAGTDAGLSKIMRHFIGGMQKLMPEVLCMVAPTVNSFSRLVPGFWAPTTATWGIENRTAAIRAIPGSAESQRVEYRIAGADANPYLALSAAIASGLWGIENAVEPSEPIRGNAYEAQLPDSLRLPTDLESAANNLKASAAAVDLFGKVFVDHFAATREWESREFRKHVTDWELQRYFESI